MSIHEHHYRPNPQITASDLHGRSYILYSCTLRFCWPLQRPYSRIGYVLIVAAAVRLTGHAVIPARQTPTGIVNSSTIFRAKGSHPKLNPNVRHMKINLTVPVTNPVHSFKTRISVL